MSNEGDTPETPEEKTTEEVQQPQGPQEPSPSIENVLDNNFQIPKSESDPVPPIVKYLKQKARDVSQNQTQISDASGIPSGTASKYERVFNLELPTRSLLNKVQGRFQF